MPVRRPEHETPPENTDFFGTASIEFYDGLLFYEYSVKQPGDRVQTWTMTTPNTSWLPNPPESHRTVRLRTDGFFGLDDPCLWPQLLYPGHEHLACIRMNDPDPNSGVSFCRNGLSAEKDGDRTQDGSHRLSHASYARCSTHMVILIGRTKTLAVSDRSTLDKLITLLRNALQQLKIFVGIAKHLKYRFAVFSRLYLELEAYINYHTITLSPTSESPIPKEGFIGAFTFSPDQANILYQQGIPVWYIRPKKVAAKESPRLLQRSHPSGPRSKGLWFDGEAIALDPDFPLEPFFTGPVSNPTHLAIIREWNLRYIFGATSQAWSPQYDPSTSSITKPYYPSTHLNSSTIGKRRGRDDSGSAGVVSSNKKQRKRPSPESKSRHSIDPIRLIISVLKHSPFTIQRLVGTIVVWTGPQGLRKPSPKSSVSLSWRLWYGELISFVSTQRIHHVPIRVRPPSDRSQSAHGRGRFQRPRSPSPTPAGTSIPTLTSSSTCKQDKASNVPSLLGCT